MFCTQCGAQTEPGTQFCKACGAKVGSAAATPGAESMGNDADAPAKPVEASPRRAQAMPISPAPEQSGGKGKIVVAAVAVLIVALAGVYFGSGLLTEPASKESRLAEAPASTAEVTPPSPVEETKSAPESSDNSQSSLFEPIPPDGAAPRAESPGPAPEAVPKALPRADVQPEPRRPQVKSAAPDAPASNRATRRSPATQASRGAGVYQTLRSTEVFETPSASARVVANIPSGVRVNVVGSSGEWLEVHSRRGNPPGFIRRDDAQPVEGGQ